MTLRLTEAEARLLGHPPPILTTARTMKVKQRSRGKDAAKLFESQLIGYGLPAFEREYPFAKKIGRRYRADFAIPQFWCLIEIEGLVVRKIGGQLVVGGRHATITGFISDARKYATAAVLGWTVLRFPQAMVRSREAIDFTQRVLAERGWIRL